LIIRCLYFLCDCLILKKKFLKLMNQIFLQKKHAHLLTKALKYRIFVLILNLYKNEPTPKRKSPKKNALQGRTKFVPLIHEQYVPT
jgi:hypothetical protein